MVEYVQIFLVIFAFLSQIQSFCWFANELTEQVSELRPKLEISLMLHHIMIFTPQPNSNISS